MKINIIGNIFGSSGYANHTRQLANALSEHHEIKLTTNLFEGWERMVNDKELKMILSPDTTEHVNLIIDLPFNWNQHCSKEKNIGFLVWEGDKIPVSFIEPILRVDQVWVPSTHVFTAIKNTVESHGVGKQDSLLWGVVKHKVKIVPHGVDLKIFKPQPKPEGPFTFLCNKGFRGDGDRGGVQHAIRAFMSEFKKDEARLLLKLNPAYAIPPDQMIQFLQKVQTELNLKAEEVPEIMINMEAIPFDRLSELYHNCDVFLNPTEAEAFSLPCLEAMACGKPVITTDFGGQTDFVTIINGWRIPYELHENKTDILYEETKWATPDIIKLKWSMRQSLKDKEDSKERGEKSLEDAKDFTWKNSAEKANEALKEL